MQKSSRIILWVYIVFNLLIAATLVLQPEFVDGPYLGGPMTATRRFQWFSIACFHVLVAAITYVSMGLPRAADRRKLHAINAGFYLWDAATQWLYWGAAIGMAAVDLHVNAGMSAVVGLLVLAVAWRDRDDTAGAGRP
jgi:Na+/pantothenate symporter